MFINIKGHNGKYNAIVTWFYKDNIEYLKEVIPNIYMREYGEPIPKYFHTINTIKELKSFIKMEMNDMRNYPFGFKHIDGTYALYQCIG